MKQTLSEFIAIKRTFFSKHADSIKNRVKNENAFTQEVFDILQNMDPFNEREIPAFEYLTGFLVTKNRGKKYEHLLGKTHMFIDLLMHHLEITKKTASQAIREEREKLVGKMDRALQISFKKLYELNAAGLDIYDAVKQYPPFIQKLVLLSYIVSQPSLSDGDKLSGIYSTNLEPTRYQQLIVQLSLEKVIRNTLFAGVYDQSISELCAAHNTYAKKPVTDEKIRHMFQAFIKSYTDPATIFSQTKRIQQERMSILQKNKKLSHRTQIEIFLQARLFYCSHMINSELIRQSFLVYRDQIQQSQGENKIAPKPIVNEEIDDIIVATRNITQEQTVIAEEITQRIIHTYGCFHNYTAIHKYLCRVISNKGTIVSHGLTNKLQEIGISCREQTINHFLKTIQNTAKQHGIHIHTVAPSRKLTGIASEQVQEALQNPAENIKSDYHQYIKTVPEAIALLETFGIQVPRDKKIDNLIQEHIINRNNHKKLGMILHIRSQLHSNNISASQVKVISLKKNKYKTIAFNDGTRMIIRENTILDICDHDAYENRRIPKFQQ